MARHSLLYGSFCCGDRVNDIDIGIYSRVDEDPHMLSAGLKIELHHRTGLIPDFFDFRNSLVHRYWQIDDRRLIENLKTGYRDFDDFIEEIEAFLEQ